MGSKGAGPDFFSHENPKEKSEEGKSSHENLVLGIIWLNFKFHMYVCEEKDFCLRRYWISVFPEGGTGNSGVGI